MNRQQAIDILAKLKPELVKRFGVTRLALFGYPIFGYAARLLRLLYLCPDTVGHSHPQLSENQIPSMYFNYPDFLKALRLSLLQKPFRIRRWLYVLFFSALFLLFKALVALLRGLDTLFFPDFRKIDVHQPVFIIAPPRSGTTFLQNVLCQDKERFIYWKMYQTIFPSICFQKLVDALVWFDRKLGSQFGRFLNWCEVKWFGEWDELHRMRLDQPEEDGAIYLYAFANEAIYLLFPFVKELWNLGFQDEPSGRKTPKTDGLLPELSATSDLCQRQRTRDADKVDTIMRGRRVPQKGIPGCAVHYYHAPSLRINRFQPQPDGSGLAGPFPGNHQGRPGVSGLCRSPGGMV